MNGPAEIVVVLRPEDAAVLIGPILTLAGDRSRDIEERAAWIVLGGQVLAGLREAGR